MTIEIRVKIVETQATTDAVRMELQWERPVDVSLGSVKIRKSDREKNERRDSQGSVERSRHQRDERKSTHNSVRLSSWERKRCKDEEVRIRFDRRTK